MKRPVAEFSFAIISERQMRVKASLNSGTVEAQSGRNPKANNFKKRAMKKKIQY